MVCPVVFIVYIMGNYRRLSVKTRENFLEISTVQTRRRSADGHQVSPETNFFSKSPVFQLDVVTEAMKGMSTLVRWVSRGDTPHEYDK